MKRPPAAEGRTGTPQMRQAITPEEAAEVLRLWADYYDAAARALEIMRVEGTTRAALPRVAAETAKAAAAMARIKEIHGLGDPPVECS
jgi:DNA invertase Pin-like site-specific DNA recombinase